jgi:hypothetical protein
LFVKVQNGYEMDELHNVSAQTPTNGEMLVYDTSSSLWQKVSASNSTVIAAAQANLQVDPAGTAVALAIALG